MNFTVTRRIILELTVTWALAYAAFGHVDSVAFNALLFLIMMGIPMGLLTGIIMWVVHEMVGIVLTIANRKGT